MAVGREPIGRLDLSDLLGHGALVGANPTGGREPGPHLPADRALEAHLEDVSLPLREVDRVGRISKNLIWRTVDFNGVREC